MGEPQQTGAAPSPGTEPPGEGAGVILTPDQRVRVFISSTLGELAAERAAARKGGQPIPAGNSGRRLGSDANS